MNAGWVFVSAARPHNPRPQQKRSLRVVSYNIHHGRGWDRCVRLERIARVLQQTGGEVIALQELDRLRPRTGQIDQALDLATRLDMHYAFLPAWEEQGEGYGLAILSRHPITAEHPIELPSVPNTREPRTALHVAIDAEGICIQFINTHLSLYANERALQAAFLAETLAELQGKAPLIVCGDLNATEDANSILPLQQVLDNVPKEAPRKKARATFPSIAPLRKLDHIFAAGLRFCRPHRSRLALMASDHLPLVAEIDLPEQSPQKPRNPD